VWYKDKLYAIRIVRTAISMLVMVELMDDADAVELAGWDS
jgi:hypothetical protein